MTWKLYLYDDNDVEIAKITTEPYDWTITHPDEKDNVRFILNGSETPTEYGDITETIDGEIYPSRTFEVIEFDSPKEHLEHIQSEFDAYNFVESTDLVDE